VITASVRRILVGACALLAVAAGAALVALWAGRPLYYTDGGNTVDAFEAADATLLAWDTATARYELPGPVLGRIATLADGRLVYGRVGANGSADLVVFDPELPRSAPIPLFGQNSDAHDFAPAIGPDGALWFSSDRRGGAGGFDLWRAPRVGTEPTSFGTPQPAVAVNTLADEVDPAPSPLGDEIVFARRTTPREGTSLLVHRFGSDGAEPVFEETRSAGYRIDREPAFHPDGVSLWFVRESPGSEATIQRTWRHRAQPADGSRFAPPVVVRLGRARTGPSGLAPRSPSPDDDGFGLLVLGRARGLGGDGVAGMRDEAPTIVYSSRAYELYPWRAGQSDLVTWLVRALAIALLLLLLLTLGDRWRGLDVVTWCLLASLALHLLLLAWFAGAQLVHDLYRPDARDTERLEVRLLASNDAAATSEGGAGPLADALGARARFREHAAETLAVERPATEPLAAERRTEASEARDPGSAPKPSVAPTSLRVPLPEPAVADAAAEPLIRTARADASDPLAAALPEDRVPADPRAATGGTSTRNTATTARITVAVPTTVLAPVAGASRERTPDVVTARRPAAPVATNPRAATTAEARPTFADTPEAATSRTGEATAVAPAFAEASVPATPAPATTSVRTRDLAVASSSTGEIEWNARPADAAATLPSRSSAHRVPVHGRRSPTPIAALGIPGTPRQRLAESLDETRAREQASALGAVARGPSLPDRSSIAPDGPRAAIDAAAREQRSVAASIPSTTLRPTSELESRSARTGRDAGGQRTRRPSPTAIALRAEPPVARPDFGASETATTRKTEVADAGRAGQRAPLPGLTSPLAEGAPAGPSTRGTEIARARPVHEGRAFASTSSSIARPGSDLRAASRTRARADTPRLDRTSSLAEAPDLYRNRVGPARQRALERFGGTDETERAVRRGLAYLAKQQRSAGHWGRPRSIRKYGETHVGKSALCMLAFLGAGHTHQSDSEYTQTMRRALDWLLEQQDRETGHFGRTSAYSHGIATYALAECHALSGDAALREPLERAIAWILANQSQSRDGRNRGGWGYFSPFLRPEDGFARTSVSSWMVMALESARIGGIDVPPEAIDQAQRFFRSMYEQRRGRGHFLYSKEPGRLASAWRTLPASSPAALFCLLLTAGATEAETEHVREGLEYVLERRPRQYARASTDRFVERGEANVYFWYYGTLACFLAGGDTWREWNEALIDTVVPAQSEDGSFAPIGAYAADYAGDTSDDSCYTTAMVVLSLEVYYRYFTPLLDRR
jgi:hypothetical protein